ncbi:MAG: hypothetical protein NC225_02385 [Clostridium sp.]|nr:hypothetical protein [Clostridium sp.]MCM1459024.1 hypothetical protein [Bacteroides sp.]
MDERQRYILQEIINKENTIEIVEILKNNKTVLKDIQIVLFEEKFSRFKGFEEKSFGKYSLCSLADYNKTWIADNKNADRTGFYVGQRAYFDINIIVRIDDYLNGKVLEDESDFIKCMNYIKDEGFEFEPFNSLIERFSKFYDERLLTRSIESFYKYMICKEFRRNVEIIADDKKEFEQFYWKCLNVKKLEKNDILNRQYDFILCLLMKAIIIKADNRCQNKVDALVEFSLNVLKCIMINELYLLCLYLKNKQEVVKKTFAKFHSSIKGGLENAVKNTAWDIYHARIIEQNMSLYDSNSQKIIFPYFVTNDNGIKDYWKINPRKMVIIKERHPINIYKHNVGDIALMLADNNLYTQMIDLKQQEKRKNEIREVNIEVIKQCLISELNNVNI